MDPQTSKRFQNEEQITQFLNKHRELDTEYFHPKWQLDQNPECPVINIELKLPQIIETFHQKMAGAHVPTRVQAAEIKQKTKRRLVNRKGSSNPTKYLLSAHQIFKAQLQRDLQKLENEEKRNLESHESSPRKKLKKTTQYFKEKRNSGSHEEGKEDCNQDGVDMDLKIKENSTEDKGDQEGCMHKLPKELKKYKQWKHFLVGHYWQ
ncbi:uncharacterized protein VP01_569g1 [Puccinia sorghi]|uniref:Uncharacterized protein n=1 Tax=Puccinia sorghi TaxID=27349 RepID=A0A0L6UIR7_9BASI|nr:uncharacterized protein VP01_569g1 [Puccinia sorghi]